MSSGDYTRSAEWLQAEDALAVCLGYKIVMTHETFVKGIGTIPEKVQRVRFDFTGEKPKTIGVGHSDRATWDLWCEAVKMRIDHAGACKLAWELYAAATGVTMKSFNGMPAGEPSAHVRAERERLLKVERQWAELNLRIDNLDLRGTLDAAGADQR